MTGCVEWRKISTVSNRSATPRGTAAAKIMNREVHKTAGRKNISNVF
jgi:hypothetical protein